MAQVLEMAHVLPPEQQEILDIFLDWNASEGRRCAAAGILGYPYDGVKWNRPLEWKALNERVISSLLRRWEGPVTIAAGLDLQKGIPNDFSDQIDNKIVRRLGRALPWKTENKCDFRFRKRLRLRRHKMLEVIYLSLLLTLSR